MQTTSQIVMIRPVNFTFNAETAVNNAFQKTPADGYNTQESARIEFDDFVAALRGKGVTVNVIDDTPEPSTPDSIFPNNWFSVHDTGELVLYPMYAHNRRAERKEHVIGLLKQAYTISSVIDLTCFEEQDKFLEGTGSMVLDRDNKIAYACLSERTHKDVLDEFCRIMNYHPVHFNATDGNGIAIYHTNVMMCIADQYAVVCLDAIPNHVEQNLLVKSIEETGKELITISLEQMNQFAGNMLQVNDDNGNKILVMSSAAYESLSVKQIAQFESYNPILHASLQTIEDNGGGSARCMMAEIHAGLQKT